MRALSYLFFAVVLSGCSAESAIEGEPIVEAEEAAVSACGTAKYNAALAHYKNAVAWSKDRLARGVCNSDNGFMWSIADEASRAVMTCGEFRNIIKTSVWAAPLRTTLANSLTLKSLTGELLVIRDSSFQNWSGVDAYFPKGLTFWARAEGAYGFAVRVDFKADGKAVWGQLNHNATTGDITWSNSPATYSISKTSERGLRTVKVTHHGRTESYTLRVENPWAVSSMAAPIFTLDPSTKTSKLFSVVSECDA
jgi:hypothetical protein